VRSGDLTHGNLDNVLALAVERHDREAGLTFLKSPGGASIAGSLTRDSVGSGLHIGLRPEDIVLALDRVSGISTRNQLPGEVRALIDEGSRVLALVDAGIELLVEVTPGAVRELALEPGRKVVCLFKANALRYLDSLPSVS